jgi:hypothetical protein
MMPPLGARFRARSRLVALPVAVAVAVVVYACWRPLSSETRPAGSAAPRAGAEPLAIAFRDRLPVLKAILEPTATRAASARRATPARTAEALTRPVVGRRPLRVMVVGASVAATFVRGLQQWADEHGHVQVLNEARFWCPLGRGLPIAQGFVVHPAGGACSDWGTRWSEAIRSFDPDVVLVFFSIWEISPRQLPGSTDWLQPGAAPLDTWQLSEYQSAADVLGARGASVDWFTIPCENEPTAVGSPLWYVNRRTIPALAASRSSVHVIDLDQEMCRSGPSNDYAGVRNARPDGAHFSPAGAFAVAKWLMPIVLGERPNPADPAGPKPGARALIRRAS